MHLNIFFWGGGVAGLVELFSQYRFDLNVSKNWAIRNELDLFKPFCFLTIFQVEIYFSVP